MNDSGFVVNEGGTMPVKAGGVVPRSEVFLLLFFSNAVSVNWGFNG